MKVSVLMPTYNHAATIGQAIDSYLMQQTDFSCELLISDDASSDDTASIAKTYAEKHPDRIRLFVKPSNEGLMKNYKSLLEMAQGQYLAILESDDYWTDERKLAKQVDFLDLHPDFGLSFTRWQRLRDGEFHLSGDETPILESHNHQLYEYLLLRNIIFSPTVCFRKALFDKYCSIADYVDLNFATFDYPVWLSIAKHAKIHYLAENTAVYRVSSTSISNSGDLDKRLGFEYETARIRRYIIQKYGSGSLKISQISKREKIVRARICFRSGNFGRGILEIFR
jgi:glycosyltransferase involved in cell wall biosynthesis